MSNKRDVLLSYGRHDAELAAAAGAWTSYELGMAEALGKRLLLLSHNYSAAHQPAELAGIATIPFDPAHPEAAAREVASRFLTPA